MNYWILKSEPEAFSIDDLRNRPHQTEPWDGVRNYQARNFLRDGMQVGDQAFFYHSNCAVPGIVGVMEVVRAGYPDPSAFDPRSKYFDPRCDPAKPVWFVVDVCYVRHTRRVIALAELKAHEALQDMALVRKGNRLSVLPLTEQHWQTILAME
ncbi:EVE domain-containing protein [Chrysiogenes arsenatis]|uniref:EVE domain-containing protein n=1 Tax=Chrysiogenes arsenatis TaxID=309797 RepID=UPI00042689DD|nr:EVE domain-containing protein [Chrysiogenes arsenatis]